MLTRKYQLLLIVLLVLAAFYPASFAGLSSVDDQSMEAGYRGLKEWDLGTIFVPAVGGGLYYRPLIGLSIRIDKFLFGFDPGIMHLENVLLHILNAFLIYFITVRVLPSRDRAGSLLPLFVALVFALHPVNAESVNWISGRTDVLAGSFLFASMLFLLKFRDVRQKKYLALSFSLFLGGALTKETSLAFLPGALLVFGATDGSRSGTGVSDELRQERTEQHPLMVPAGVVLALALFFLFRSAAFTSSASRIGLTLGAMNDDWIHSMFMVLRAFGFYMKKLICPYPLNFAIIEVDPLYEVLAVPLLLICIYIATRRTVLTALFTTGVLLITPSFILAFGQIAWTPYAERYIYLTSAFFVLAVIVSVARAVPVRSLSMVKFGSAAIILILFIAMFQRSLIWQDDLKLAKDTVTKTPDFKPLRNSYAMQLARKGEYAAAKEQLEKARELYERVYDPRSEFIMAYINYKEARIEEAQKILEQVVERTHGTSTEALEYLVSLLEERRRAGVSKKESHDLERSLFRHNLRLYALTGDPHILYDLGGSAERMGDQGRALRLYRQARNNLPDGDDQKRSSIRKIDALSKAKGNHHAEEARYDH